MVDGIGAEAVLLGMPGFVVRAVVEDDDGEVWGAVETTATAVGCPACGVRARSKGRRRVQVRDLSVGGRSVRLVWSKRRWTCPDPDCGRGSWTETHPEIQPRAVLSERTRRWVFGHARRGWRWNLTQERRLGLVLCEARHGEPGAGGDQAVRS
jgi:transposase